MGSGNGGLGQKHSAGIYSTTRPSKRFQEASRAETQDLVDTLDYPLFTEKPNGAAEIVTYSVQHGREGPKRGLVIGRLILTGEQFIANTPVDPEVFKAMQASDWIGRTGVVTHSVSGKNLFHLDELHESRL